MEKSHGSHGRHHPSRKFTLIQGGTLESESQHPEGVAEAAVPAVGPHPTSDSLTKVHDATWDDLNNQYAKQLVDTILALPDQNSDAGTNPGSAADLKKTALDPTASYEDFLEARRRRAAAQATWIAAQDQQPQLHIVPPPDDVSK